MKVRVHAYGPSLSWLPIEYIDALNTHIYEPSLSWLLIELIDAPNTHT
jgi:hypothetical protein